MTIISRMAVCAGLIAILNACGTATEADVDGNCLRTCTKSCDVVWVPDPANSPCSDACDDSVAAASAEGCLSQANLYYACASSQSCSSSTNPCASHAQAYRACLN